MAVYIKISDINIVKHCQREFDINISSVNVARRNLKKNEI